MSKEPFLQISKRRNGMKWQERLGVRFIALISVSYTHLTLPTT